MNAIRHPRKTMDKAILAIRKGEVIVCPTDTVYGFLADAGNKRAVEKIFKIKKRPKTKPLAVFVKDMKAARELAEINKKQEKILKKHWPGKFTFILKSKLVTKSGTIALRIPKYKFLNDLLKKINKPLVQTSVNISGQPPLTKISDIKKLVAETGFSMFIIDAGDLKKSKPSKIIDLTAKNLTRLR